MPLSAPTYSTSYTKTEQDTNAALLAGAINTAQTSLAGAVHQLITALAARDNPYFGPYFSRAEFQPILDALKVVSAAL